MQTINTTWNLIRNSIVQNTHTPFTRSPLISPNFVANGIVPRRIAPEKGPPSAPWDFLVLGFFCIGGRVGHTQLKVQE